MCPAVPTAAADHPLNCNAAQNRLGGPLGCYVAQALGLNQNRDSSPDGEGRR
jgi:hypothetical protein